MNQRDVKKTLESMVIICDTREKPTLEAAKRYAAFECQYERSCIQSGDYSAKFKLPNGEWLDLRNKVVFERKGSITEICSNFTIYRKRFVAEFERMKRAGTKCYILIEYGSWEQVLSGNYRSKMLPNALMSSMTAWLARYDCQFIMCKPESTARIIKEILYREGKEILEAIGEADNEKAT